jgi:hypothetical protein
MQVIPLPRYVQAIPLFIGIAGIFLEYLLETVEILSKTILRLSAKKDGSS